MEWTTHKHKDCIHHWPKNNIRERHGKETTKRISLCLLLSMTWGLILFIIYDNIAKKFKIDCAIQLRALVKGNIHVQKDCIHHWPEHNTLERHGKETTKRKSVCQFLSMTSGLILFIIYDNLAKKFKIHCAIQFII